LRLTAAKKGRQNPATTGPVTQSLTAENQKLRRDNERLADRRRNDEIVIDVQKTVMPASVLQ
jgi:hypothetical protein